MSSPDTQITGPKPDPRHDTPCPYCARKMRWMGDGRRRGSGWFDCEQCGTFDVHGWVPPQLPVAPPPIPPEDSSV